MQTSGSAGRAPARLLCIGATALRRWWAKPPDSRQLVHQTGPLLPRTPPWRVVVQIAAVGAQLAEHRRLPEVAVLLDDLAEAG